MSEYSVEAVRNSARLLDGLSRRMLNDYADLLEQIERTREGVTDEAVTRLCVKFDEMGYGYPNRDDAKTALKAVAHLLPSGERGGVEADTTLRQAVRVDEGLIESAKACADRLQHLCETRLRGKECAEARADYLNLRDALLSTHPSRVAALAEQWRDKSRRLKAHPDCDAVVSAMADELDRCAAALEAALAQPAQVAGDGPRRWDAHGNPCCATPTAEPVAQGEAVPSWVDALAEKWACCIAADHFAGPTLRQCASELLDAAYGRKGPPYSFVYGLGRAQPRAVPDDAWPRLELWFFRELVEAQRLKLFALHGMPVDEIGASHVHQKRALRQLLAAPSQGDQS